MLTVSRGSALLLLIPVWLKPALGGASWARSAVLLLPPAQLWEGLWLPPVHPPERQAQRTGDAVLIRITLLALRSNVTSERVVTISGGLRPTDVCQTWAGLN